MLVHNLHIIINRDTGEILRVEPTWGCEPRTYA
jgi:hypothetical protein